MMKILLLSPYGERLLKIYEVIRAYEPSDICEIISDDINFREVDKSFDMIISYGYGHIIKGPWYSEYEGSIINIHISYLPYNRGASPNLWAHYEGTPSGVSIHLIDQGIDTGPIITRRAIIFSPEDTLRTSYNRLHNEAAKMFYDFWPQITDLGYSVGLWDRISGSYHTKKESEILMARLPDGYDTKIKDVAELGRRDRNETEHNIHAGRGGPLVQEKS